VESLNKSTPELREINELMKPRLKMNKTPIISDYQKETNIDGAREKKIKLLTFESICC
jgi:hypothetical protein